MQDAVTLRTVVNGVWWGIEIDAGLTTRSQTTLVQRCFGGVARQCAVDGDVTARTGDGGVVAV